MVSVSVSWTAVLLASLATLAPVAQAQIQVGNPAAQALVKPSLFFNYTFKPQDCVMGYSPGLWQDPNPAIGLTLQSNSTWAVEYTESPDAQPGIVGQGRQQAVLRIKQGSEDSASLNVVLPTNNVWMNGTANASYSMPFGGPNPGDPRAWYSADDNTELREFTYGGDFVANYTFADFGAHTFLLTVMGGGRENDTVFAVYDVVATIGIETAATSFDTVPKRVEPLARDGQLNPFFNLSGFSNWTIMSEPNDVVVGNGSLPTCTFSVPRNTSLVTIDGWTEPNASSSVSIYTLPATPYEAVSAVMGDDRSYTIIENLWSNFTGPTLVHFAVLDPKVEYIISLDASAGTLPLRSATFYSSLAFVAQKDNPADASDTAPEGGGPASMPDPVLPTPNDPNAPGAGFPNRTSNARAPSSATTSPSGGGSSSAGRTSTLRAAVLVLVAAAVGVGVYA